LRRKDGENTTNKKASYQGFMGKSKTSLHLSDIGFDIYYIKCIKYCQMKKSSKIKFIGNGGFYKGNSFESFNQSFQWKVNVIHIHFNWNFALCRLEKSGLAILNQELNSLDLTLQNEIKDFT